MPDSADPLAEALERMEAGAETIVDADAQLHLAEVY